MEVHDIVQVAANKTIQKKNKSKKAKWLSEKALPIAEGGREAKSKGERGKYIQPNAGFQRIAKRDKKVFSNEQCLKIEENNRRRETRYLFRKIGTIKRTFCPKMVTIKDRIGIDIVRAVVIKTRWKEYTEELHPKKKKKLMNQIIMMV